MLQLHDQVDCQARPNRVTDPDVPLVREPVRVFDRPPLNPYLMNESAGEFPPGLSFSTQRIVFLLPLGQ